MMSGDIFERLMPSLVRFLSLESVRPYLLQKGLLTGEEYSQLLAGGWGGQAAQTEWAVVRMKRRGSNAALLFLEALEECLSAEHNAGHEELVQLMRKELQQPPSNKGMDSGQQRDPAMQVAYLQMVNHLIDGLQRDPEAFGRSVMGLRLLGVYPGPSVTDLPQLFAFLVEGGHCGPWDTSLLRSLLQSLNRTDLLVCLEGFQGDTSLPLSSTTLTTHHTRAMQSVVAVCGRLSEVVGVSLAHSVSQDSGYSHKWTLGGHIPPPHTLQTALAMKVKELKELDIQRVFLDTSSGRYKLFEDQSSETSQGLSDLNAACSERVLFSFSQHLASWERLGPSLGFSWAEMQEIQHDKPSYGEQKLQLLLRWKRKLGSGATFQVLADAALTSGDRQFAETVHQLAHDFV